MIWSLLFLPLIPTFFRFLFACHGSLISLRSVEDYAILPFSPTDLSVADVVLVICLFIGRSIRKALGYGHVHKAGARSRQSEQMSPASQEADGQQMEEDTLVHLQRLELAMPLHIRSSDIAQYRKTISSNSSEANKSISLTTGMQYTNDVLTSDLTHLTLFLSAISEPALLLLLARKGCPIEPLGSVNARNHFELLRPGLCKRIIKEAELTPAKSQSQPTSTSQTLSPGTSKDQMLENSVLASLPPTARPVKRGLEIDITVSIYTRLKQTRTDKWGPNIEVFRQVFTILQFTTTSTSSSTASSKPASTIKSQTSPTSDPHPNPATTIPLTLSKSDPLEWAKISKDYNPIHISTFAARAFGFKGIIAHGNHVVAKALSTLPLLLDVRNDSSAIAMVKGRGPSMVDSREEDELEEEGIYMNISFRRPILVPSEVGVRLVGTVNGEGGEEGEEDKEKGGKIYRENVKNGEVKIEVFKGEKVNIEIGIGRLSTST